MLKQSFVALLFCFGLHIRPLKLYYMRKTFTLIVALLCLAFVSRAQISKGSTFLGGSLTLNSSKSEPTAGGNTVENKTSNWGINPQIGIATASNKIVGVFLSFNASSNKQSAAPNTSSTYKTNGFGGGVFYRRYFLLSTRFYLFGQGSIGGTSVGEEGANNNGITNYIYLKRKGFGINGTLLPGVSFAAGRKVHLEAGLNNLLTLAYQHTKKEEYTAPNTLYRTTPENSFSANVNANGFSSLFIGLRWILPSKS